MVGSGVRVSPGASSWTAKSVTPAGVRAATTIRLAVCPSITYILWPFSVQPSPFFAAASSMPPKSHRPLSSVMASVAIVSPRAMPGRYAFFDSSSPDVKSALAANATEEKNGAHSNAAPISSSTTSSST